MTIKNLFNKTTTTFESMGSASTDAESSDNLRIIRAEKETFVPPIDFTTSSNFIKYGSAKLYYKNSIERIYEEYPYDGSLAERNEYNHSSSALDRWILKYKYPKTNGYINLGLSGFGGTLNQSSSYNLYVGNEEYISILGGIHTASQGMKIKSLDKTFDKSGVYDESTNRIRNISVDLVNGSTVEFWLKKENYKDAGQYEVVFDLWNGETSASSDYGRMTIEMKSTGTPSPFEITLFSGSSGFVREPIGTHAATFDWTHFAFSFVSESSGIRSRMYVNGKENDNKILGTSFDKMPKAPNAYIGSLMANAHGTTYHHSNKLSMKGYGKLSGSLDEFRFWKVRRTSREIERDYYHPIGGGQNKKDSDNLMKYLGFYYKFNEGITGNDSTDSKVLDYSGRIVNGSWVGYPGSSARSTGSALVESKVLNLEPLDPIIYSSHPDVSALLSEMETSGSDHDRLNGIFLYDMMPSWMREEDEINGENLKKLMQIIASYFDTLYSQITALTTIHEKRYYEIDNDKFDEYPSHFAKNLVENRGLIVPELFPNSNILELFMQRDYNNLKFKLPLATIKNLIYQNIYNNIDLIFKSKGTEASIRNLIRCFGIDDELLKFNIYTDGGTHYLRDNNRVTSCPKRYINFNSPEHFSSTIYQTSSDINSNTYIYGNVSPYNEQYMAMTYEADIIVPYKIPIQNRNHFSTDFTVSSIFGQHGAVSDPADYTWHSNDYPNFQVFLVREKLESKNAYFQLSSSTLNINLTSSTFNDIYNNNRWNLGVRIKPSMYSLDMGIVSTPNPNYIVEFYGVSNNLGTIENEFELKATVSNTIGKNFLSSLKRVYAGAHLQNFTGSAVHNSDIKFGNLRVWMDYLENATIRSHNLDPVNYGSNEGAYSNPTPFASVLSTKQVTKPESLLLSWNFETVTGSDSNGGFTTFDYASGSTDTVYGWVDKIIRRNHVAKGAGFTANDEKFVPNEYILALKKNLPEIATTSDRISLESDEDKFITRDDDDSDNLFSIEKSMSQVISEEMLNMFSSVKEFSNLIGKAEHRYRDKNKRLKYLRHLFFQRISSDLDFNRFTKYYKWIDSSITMMIKQLIPVSIRFSKEVSNVVESHILERNKYMTKYPFFKNSDTFEGTAKGVNELHWNWLYGHAPTSSPSSPENKNCLWWEQQASRETDVKTGVASIDSQRENIRRIVISETSASGPNLAKSDKTIYQGSAFALRRFSNISKMSVFESKAIHAGTNYDRRKNRNLIHEFVRTHGPVTQNGVPVNVVLAGAGTGSGLVPTKDCIDNLSPALDTSQNVIYKKQKRAGSVEIGKHYQKEYIGVLNFDMALPFNVVSAAVPSGVDKIVQDEYGHKVIFTNIHSDTYGGCNDIGLQGPFTNHYVGGHQHRHIALNKADSSKKTWVYDQNTQTFTSQSTTNYLDDPNTRPEAWRLLVTSSTDPDGIFGIVGPDYGGPYPDPRRLYAHRYREELVKRPLNIKNIKTIRPTFDTLGNLVTSGSTYHGNYYSNYEVVQTCGQMGNKSFLKASIGSKDNSEYESPLLPEAMTSVNSLIYSGSPLLTDATHYSALYGRRPSALHNDGNIFLREPKFAGEGSSSPTRYCANFSPGGDKGWKIANLISEYTSMTNQQRFQQFTFSSWFQPSSIPDSSYSIILKVGDAATQQNVSFASYELVIARPKGATDYKIRFMVSTDADQGVWETQANYSFAKWIHVVVEYNPTNHNSIDVEPIVMVDGVQQTGKWQVQPANQLVLPSGDSYMFLDGGSTSRLKPFNNESPVGYVGYVSDCTMWHKLGGLNTNTIKRLYNRGFLIDPKNISDEQRIFWFTMGRSPYDTSNGSDIVAVFDALQQKPNTSIYLKDNGTDLPTYFEANFSSWPLAPKVVDTSNYIWEYAFDRDLAANENTNSDSLFINRFSAPGGPEIMSKGFLDAANGEYSVYNAMPFRNSSVLGFSSGESSGMRVVDHLGDRYGLKTHLARHCGKFGLDSVYGSAYHCSFNGTNSYINIGTTSTWDAILGDESTSNKKMSFSFWFNVRDLSANGYIFSFGDLGISTGYTNQLLFQADWTGDDGLWRISTLSENQWYHAVVTYDATTSGNTPTFYINGAEVAVTTVGSGTGTYLGVNGTNCYVGSKTGSTYHFNGLLDEMAIWDRILTIDEAKDIYDKGRTNSIEDTDLALTAKLWYRMGEDDSSAAIYDNSPSSQHSVEVNNVILALDSEDKPSYFKQHRNTLHRRRINDSGNILIDKIHDNANINTPIPRSDFQYSWINNAIQSHNWKINQHILNHAPPSGMVETKTDLSVSSRSLKIAAAVDDTFLYRGAFISESTSDFAASNFTLAFWASFEEPPIGQQQIVWLHELAEPPSTTTTHRRFIYLVQSPQGTRLYMVVPDKLGNYHEKSWSIPADNLNKWTHYVFSFKAAGNMYLFIDGSGVTHDTHTAAPNTTPMTNEPTSNFFSFGGSAWYGGQRVSVKGKLDEFAFYTTALLQSDVTTLYNSGSPYNHSSTSDFQPYLKGWWRFGDLRDMDGERYTLDDKVGFDASDYNSGFAKIYDRSGANNHFAAIDVGPNYPNISIVEDTFKIENVQTTNYVEAILFPSASEIVGV